MKAYSCGLEICVEAERIKIVGIKDKPIETILHFRDNNGLRREIPMTINYDGEQREFVEYSQIPDGVYAGDSEKIKLTINENYFNDLLENDRCIERFMSSGKLYIKIID